MVRSQLEDPAELSGWSVGSDVGLMATPSLGPLFRSGGFPLVLEERKDFPLQSFPNYRSILSAIQDGPSENFLRLDYPRSC